MATISRFEEIISWQEARKLNSKKNYRLIGQIEGSAGSIMDNIAEGFERRGNKEFIQFLYIAKASCGELRSQLYRAIDRNYLTDKEFESLTVHAKRISSLLQNLIIYLKESGLKGEKSKKVIT